MSRIVVLHDLGDHAGGAPWVAALEACGLSEVVGPDLPGHGSAEAPVGGTAITDFPKMLESCGLM